MMQRWSVFAAGMVVLALWLSAITWHLVRAARHAREGLIVGRELHLVDEVGRTRIQATASGSHAALELIGLEETRALMLHVGQEGRGWSVAMDSEGSTRYAKLDLLPDGSTRFSVSEAPEIVRMYLPGHRPSYVGEVLRDAMERRVPSGFWVAIDRHGEVLYGAAIEESFGTSR